MNDERIPFDAAMAAFKTDIVAMKKQAEERGHPCDWLDQVPDTSESCALFLPRGKMKNGITTYRSKCPHYTGCWLCGGFSAVNCALVDQPLSGVVKSIACIEDHEKCPLKQYISKE